MKINKNSWHYKLSTSFERPWVADNLCAYMRQVLLGVFLLAIVGILLLVLSLMAIAMVVSIFITPPSLFAAIFICFLWIVVGFMVRRIALDFLPRGSKLLTIIYDGKTSGGEDNIVTAYIKAKHNKVCPTLDFI